MAKARITVPNGPDVTIEGTPDEVKQILEFYRAAGEAAGKDKRIKKKPTRRSPSKARTSADSENEADLAQIVNLVKSCDEAETIESQILDRTSQVNRTLLPLYIVHEYMENNYKITSGDIARITTDLGIPISTANASRTLSGTAAKYVMGDKVRKMGRVVGYKLSRRGVQYMKEVIKGSAGDN